MVAGGIKVPDTGEDHPDSIEHWLRAPLVRAFTATAVSSNITGKLGRAYQLVDKIRAGKD